MKILVANIGSTSLKWRLFEFAGEEERLLHKGGLERVSDYAQAIRACLKQLREGGHIRSAEDVAAVGFKTVVARGVTGCVRLDERVLAAMEAFNGLAPAHNPPYIAGIRWFAQEMPGVPLVGLFETAFYQWAPAAAQRYAVPESWYEMGVRRHGFHGASHKYIAERSAELMGREDVARRVRQLYVDGGTTPVRAPALRVISCHLGGSSSVTGLRDGMAVGNSLGMSPQSGLPHNNRVGDMDVFALLYVMRETGMNVAEAERVLCRESGLKALSGGYNDMRDITARAQAGEARARLALDHFVHAVRHWIGAFWVELNGVDALVFTAGIGENDVGLRAAVCRGLEEMGLVLDGALNEQTRGREGVISAATSRVKVMVIPTNEELVVARETRRLLSTECEPGSNAKNRE